MTVAEIAATTTVPAVPPPAPPARTSRAAPRGLVATGLAVAALFAVPLGYLVWRNVSLGTEALSALRDEDAGALLARTLILATVVAVAATVLGSLLAWLLVRTDLPGRRAWRVLVPLPLVLPSFVGALALLGAFAPGGLLEQVLAPFGVDELPRMQGFGPTAFVLTLLTYPYVYLPVAARLAALPPSLEESARALGRGPWPAFRTVVLPQLTGAMWAGGLLVFLYALSEFGVVQLLRYDTLTRAIYATRLFDPDTAMALSLLLGVVAIAVVAVERLFARRRFATEASSAGRPTLRVRLGGWRLPGLLLVGGVVGLALVAPVVVLGYWVLRGVLGDAELRVDSIVTPTVTTVGLGVVAAVVTVLAVLPLAYLVGRYRSRVGEGANAVVVAGFALPGLVVALSLVFLVLQAPALAGLYQTLPLLVLAYAMHFGSQGMSAAQVTVSGMPARVGDAARSLGAGRLRRLATVDFPLMKGGLAAGLGLVMLSVMKELPATLVLAPPGTETLATRIWAATEDAFFAEAGLLSLVLLAASGALTWLLTVRPLTRAS